MHMDGNLINTLGVIALLSAHATLSFSDRQDRLAYGVSGAGAVLVGWGSFLLGSWPVVVLNVAWAYFSFARVFRQGSVDAVGNRPAREVAGWVCKAMSGGRARSLPVAVLLVLALHAILMVDLDLAAFVAAAIYLGTYFLLAAGVMGKQAYLLAGIVGYAMVMPHLVHVGSWAVMANETLGAGIALAGLARMSQTPVVPGKA